MVKSKTQRRRTKPEPVPELLSPWKRSAAAAAFGIGGGGCAYWGIHDLVLLGRALGRAAAVVETQSAMPGLPLMGIGLVAIGALFLVPAASTVRFRRVQERLAIAVLVSLVVGALLGLVGGPIVRAVMEAHDYRSCEVRHGRRMTFVTWAAQGADCPPGNAER